MEMFQKQDKDHFAAMQKMTELMEQPNAMPEWFEAKKKEFLAQCEEVRLPITYRKIETINIDGKEIDKELFDEVMRNAYFEKFRQEEQTKSQSN